MWEYYIGSIHWFTNYNNDLNEDKFDEYGKDGWELAAIHGEEVIFKRKKSEEDER